MLSADRPFRQQTMRTLRASGIRRTWTRSSLTWRRTTSRKRLRWGLRQVHCRRQGARQAPSLLSTHRGARCVYTSSCLPQRSADTSEQLVPTDLQQQLAAESLYRDANTLLYADNKPSEEAIDRVVAKMNKECVHPPCQPQCYVLTLRDTASTKRSDSPGSGPTRIRATSHTSTNATGCSTRRCAIFRLVPQIVHPHQ